MIKQYDKIKEAVHNGVNVRIKIADGQIGTVHPSYDQP